MNTEEYLATLKLQEIIDILKFQRTELLRIIKRGDGGNPNVRRTIEEGRGLLEKVENLLALFGQSGHQKRGLN
jgi:hypothetical protein